MPAKKKTSARPPSASRTGRTASRTGRAVKAASTAKTASKSSAAKRTTRKTTTAKAPARAARTARATRTGRTSRAAAPPASRRKARSAASSENDDLLLVSDDQVTTGADAGSDAADVTESAAPRSGVAVIGQTPSASPADETPVIPMSDDEVHRFPEDIPVALASLVLAVAPFLPWYSIARAAGAKSITATGWATGTWGPMVALFGAFSFVLAMLRILKIKVKLPYAESTFHEGVGWIALVATVIKFKATPATKGVGGIHMGASYGIWVSIGAAFLLAFLAGRMNSSSPFAPTPSWFSGKPGKIGAALLAIAIAGSAAFGMTNNVNLAALLYGPAAVSPGGGSQFTPPANLIKGEFPACAKAFPKPGDAKPISGTEGASCTFSYTTGQTVDATFEFYKTKLTSLGYTFKAVDTRSTVEAKAMTFSSPQCGAVYIQHLAKQSSTQVAIAIYQCVAAASPRPSSSR